MKNLHKKNLFINWPAAIKNIFEKHLYSKKDYSTLSLSTTTRPVGGVATLTRTPEYEDTKCPADSAALRRFTRSVAKKKLPLSQEPDGEKLLFRKEKIVIRIKSFDFFYIKKIIEKLHRNLFYINNKKIDVFKVKEFREELLKTNFSSSEAAQKISCGLFYPRSYNFASTPIKIEKFTVERSPHIDKKSREQFQRTTYSCLLSINIQNDLQQHMSIVICKQIKKSGAFVEIESKFFDFF